MEIEKKKEKRVYKPIKGNAGRHTTSRSVVLCVQMLAIFGQLAKRRYY